MVQGEFETAFALRSGGAPGEAQTSAAGRLFVRVPAGWDAGAPLMAAAATVDGSAEFVPWRSDTERYAGIAIHAALETIAREGLESWPLVRAARERSRWRHHLLTLGVPAAELEQCVLGVQRALETTLSDERGRWLLAPHAEACCEYPIGTGDGHFRIDRTFVDETGTRWIIDYKTAAPAPAEDIDVFLDRQQEGHAAQLERYAAVFAGLDPNRPVQAALYFPLVGGWREVSLSRESRRASG